MPLHCSASPTVSKDTKYSPWYDRPGWLGVKKLQVTDTKYKLQGSKLCSTFWTTSERKKESTKVVWAVDALISIPDSSKQHKAVTTRKQGHLYLSADWWRWHRWQAAGARMHRPKPRTAARHHTAADSQHAAPPHAPDASSANCKHHFTQFGLTLPYRGLSTLNMHTSGVLKMLYRIFLTL